MGADTIGQTHRSAPTQKFPNFAPMREETKQVLRYGLGTLAIVSGFLLAFCMYWQYEDLAPVLAQFNAERYWLHTMHDFGFSRLEYQTVQFIFFGFFTGSLALLYQFRETLET